MMFTIANGRQTEPIAPNGARPTALSALSAYFLGSMRKKRLRALARIQTTGHEKLCRRQPNGSILIPKAERGIQGHGAHCATLHPRPKATGHERLRECAINHIGTEQTPPRYWATLRYMLRIWLRKAEKHGMFYECVPFLIRSI